MYRIIPPHTKQKANLVLGLTWIDLLIFFVAIVGSLIFIWLDLPTLARFIGICCFLLVGIVCLIPVGNGMRGWQFFYRMLKFWFRAKTLDAISLKVDAGLQFGNDYVKDTSTGLYSMYVEVRGIDFGILDLDLQDDIINSFAKGLKSLKAGKIVKVDKPLDLEPYINRYQKKVDELILEYDSKKEELGNKITQEIKNFYESRIDVLNNKIRILKYKNTSSPTKVEYFVLIGYDYNYDDLKMFCENIISNFADKQVESRMLNLDDIKSFYEYFYDAKFDELSEDLIMNSVTEHWNHLNMNGLNYRIMTLGALPMWSGNAWLNQVFRLNQTKVVLNFTRNSDTHKVAKAIQRSRIELETRYMDKRTTDIQRKEIEKSLGAFDELLNQITNFDVLFNVQFFILYPSSVHKMIDEHFRNNTLFTNRVLFEQMDAYYNMQLYNPNLAYVECAQKQLPSSTLAGTFPFVSKLFQDPYGNYLGDDMWESDHPIWFDQFYSWQSHKTEHSNRARVNANLLVLGKSGGGKSYFMKIQLMSLLMEGVKVFILDPENEYEYLVNKFGGNLIDAGGLTGDTRVNPLQVFSNGDADSGEARHDLTGHIQFLQQWFEVVGVAGAEVDGIDGKVISSVLNDLIVETYRRKNITGATDIRTLKNEDFPILNDLYEVCVESYENASVGSREKEEYRKLMILLKDFSNEGIHAPMWNGITTLELTNDFTVFNFQSLLANDNKMVANGQMLLLMRYLMQEVIRNKNNNDKLGIDKNVVVAVDEAHTFINPKQPYALHFMEQMAKRVRKYGGGLIVTTQNLADFLGGNEDVKKSASAVINACQYSVLFGLAPNDLQSMIELYKNSGSLNKEQQRILKESTQGQCLFLLDPKTRIAMQVHSIDRVFEEGYYLAPPRKPSVDVLDDNE